MNKRKKKLVDAVIRKLLPDITKDPSRHCFRDMTCASCALENDCFKNSTLACCCCGEYRQKHSGCDCNSVSGRCIQIVRNSVLYHQIKPTTGGVKITRTAHLLDANGVETDDYKTATTRSKAISFTQPDDIT